MVEQKTLFLQLKLAMLSMLRANGMIKNENVIDRLFIAEQLTADLVMDEAGFNVSEIPFDITLSILYILCGVARKEIKKAENRKGGNYNEGRVDKKYCWNC